MTMTVIVNVAVIKIFIDYDPGHGNTITATSVLEPKSMVYYFFMHCLSSIFDWILRK